MKEKESTILLFDGVCNLCNWAVIFIIKRDRKEKIKFASLQSEFGQSFLKQYNLATCEINSVVFIKNDNYFIKSTAVLEVLKTLDGVWKYFYFLISLPHPVSDFMYDLLAKYRYKIFGKRDNCMIPRPDIEERFLS